MSEFLTWNHLIVQPKSPGIIVWACILGICWAFIFGYAFYCFCMAIGSIERYFFTVSEKELDEIDREEFMKLNGRDYTMANYTEAEITRAQKLLQQTGSTVKVNGKFTIGMSTAIYTFQRKAGIPVTGELDAETWKALKKAAKNQNGKDGLEKSTGVSIWMVILGAIVALGAIGVLLWQFVF